MPEWKRRALDRAEQRVLDFEKKLLNEITKYGVPNFDIVMNLALCYVDRARERVKRQTATEEDLKILERIKFDSSIRNTRENN
jgi:hypothetical protein